MKKPEFMNCEIMEGEKEVFERSLIRDNVRRGRILAFSIILLEIILAISDVLTGLLKVDSRFHFNAYLFMYTLMICVNVVYLLHIRQYEKLSYASVKKTKHMKIGIVLYITFVMTWGSIVSIMDQKLYGQIIVFMIMMIISSVLYFLDNKMIVVPYAFAISVLVIGLPFFQKSTDILIGHYVNLTIFIFTSWLASRIVFHSYVCNFNNECLLHKSKSMLEVEVEEKRILNEKLMIANTQLKQLALIDELTEIPNRRGFKNYMDIAFENHKGREFSLSVMMLDIDFFKQYNDNYGHDAGDRVLIRIAMEIDMLLKTTGGFFCRWGGEEFIYILLHTAEEDMVTLAENVRKRVRGLAISNAHSKADQFITISAGTSTSKVSHQEDVGKLIHHADKALYQAKGKGRNCVVAYKNEISAE